VSKVDEVIAAAGVIGQLIKMIADMTGEPLADVRKRVLAQVAKDAADPSDETDKVADAIDADMPVSDR
jgi:hypothetical protein